MGSVSSDDDGGGSERCGSYSLSADVSESESCTSSSNFSCRRGLGRDGGCASSSMTSSPRPVAGGFCFPAPVMVPVIGGKDVVVWGSKNEKRRETDLSGKYIYIFFILVDFNFYDFLVTIFFFNHFFKEAKKLILRFIYFLKRLIYLL
jgi:hypothetical protein